MKINASRVLTPLLLVLSMMLAGSAVFADDGAFRGGQLTSEIDYWYVRDQGQVDDEGRELVWLGTIEGDFTGEIKWWFVTPSPVSSSVYTGGWVAFYAARWEIWVGDEMLLAGESTGKTVFPDEADGMWDGHGIVTEASEGLDVLNGAKVYETGPVVWGSSPPPLFTGTGMFVIYYSDDDDSDSDSDSDDG